MNLFESAIKRAITYTMVFIAIGVFGIVSLLRLKPELLPDITFPTAAVIVWYSGVGPEDIETLIVRPVEESVATINRVKEIRSTCREGIGTTIIDFEWGTDMDVVISDIRERVSFAKRLFPEDAEEPLVFKFDPSMWPILFVGLSGDLGPAQMREIAKDKVEPRMERIDGVAVADTHGGLEREIQVRLDRRRMEAFGLSIEKVVSAVRDENLNLPGGDIKEKRNEYLIRTLGEFRSVEEIGDIVVSKRGTTPIYLRDVAVVEDSFKERERDMRLNGKPSVLIVVQKRTGANTVETADKIREEIGRLNRELPRGVRLEILMDQSEFIKKSIRNLSNVAVLGGILAVLVLFFFLRSLRTTMIIALSIPFSIVACFVALYFAGLTLNMMSLGGLALAVGLLVDNSIVVLENIFRHREKGEPAKEGAIWGTREVAMPIIASTLTTIAVFLPIFFVPGIAGVLFKEQALTVTLSLTVSLFVALTLVPLLASRLVVIRANNPSGKMTSKIYRLVGNWFGWLQNRYEKLLNWSLDHRRLTIICVGGLFFTSLILVWPLRLVGTEFMPKMDEGRIEINLELPVGSRLEATEEVVKKVERIVQANTPELEYVRSRIGTGMGFGGGRAGAHTAQVALELVDLKERKRSQWQIMAMLREKLKNIPGVRMNLGGGRRGRMMMGLAGSPISVEIYGYDFERAKRLSEQVKQIVEDTHGAVDVESDFEEAKPEFQIYVDRKRAASLGLNVSSIAHTIQDNIYGKEATQFRQRGEEYPILVRLQQSDRKDIEDIRNIPIFTSQGERIPLGTLVEMRPARGPVTIHRKMQERVITVSADYEGRDLGTIIRDIGGKLKSIVLPQDFSIVMAGEAKEQRESFMWLGIALLGAIFLVYMVMASQFESLLDPFVIMFAFPLAIIGVIWLLFLSHTTFNIIAFVGVIVLSGIVVNNGIVLVDYINLLRARGLGFRQAIVQGGRTRLRPVLMTALTTILAMTPMALGIGEGAEFRFPLARAIVGGLAVATFFTLVFIPVLYATFETRIARRRKIRSK
jgi:HAE1 family hydrophobic/amphiphilic exporter-1